MVLLRQGKVTSTIGTGEYSTAGDMVRQTIIDTVNPKCQSTYSKLVKWSNILEDSLGRTSGIVA